MRWLIVPITAIVAVLLWAQEGEKKVPDTGLKVGDAVPAYNPIHVAGPDKGTDTCPV
ncbi:MAG: hypothetical protein NZ959_03955 [Armatimonadetes bacterium]|nr:hypothetical protein [Armatimonadota bacterium]MDW8122378.1 hypothetical protein [Armatimonadota bacterium]